ncbi:MBL fold metallo-hydrolase [Pseudonocardia oroxyli]|uniref:Glyoxylase, beta-lactamase superfamily II n=1 Tax=Pseudonocardia oroxyli TaxID=366584 RepID=A0A1G7JLE7_PSEOR|nr:MBL fold metallo-hydrolase [Pseudonocardia oroxyli]SDF25757.1 Glyoxylase, beta-lactamase superfamily II [Pseudonocardia oroxyli]
MTGGVEVVGTAQQRAWVARVLPPVERLEAGMWSVPVPIPDNPLRYTLCYLIPTDDGVVVVDPGWDSPEGWSALEAGLTAAGARAEDVVGIVATHIHPDHHGLSGRLAERSGAWIAMHPEEAATLPERGSREGRSDTMAGWLCGCGASEPEIDELTGPQAWRPDFENMARPDVLLADGDPLPVTGRRVTAVWTPGHTPGHICLLETDARVMLTGDHVLPRITPNIGMTPHQPDSPALATFLDSLDKVARQDEELGGLTALPAHEYRFRGLAARARALQAHHAERCAELLDIVREAGRPTMWEVTARLTWSRPWDEVGRMRIGALAETASHVRYLADRGLLVCDGDPLMGAPQGDETVTVRAVA